MKRLDGGAVTTEESRSIQRQHCLNHCGLSAIVPSNLQLDKYSGEKSMGSTSIWHWLILLVIGLLVFGGKGKISSIMGDMAEGIKSFKKGLADDDATKQAEESKKQIEARVGSESGTTGTTTNKTG